jgi:hypothetical protein
VSYDEATQDLPSNKFIGAGKLPLINEDIIIPSNPAVNLVLDAPYEHLNKMLKPDLKENIDYELVSQAMWSMLTIDCEHILITLFMEKTPDGKKV